MRTHADRTTQPSEREPHASPRHPPDPLSPGGNQTLARLAAEPPAAAAGRRLGIDWGLAGATLARAPATNGTTNATAAPATESAAVGTSPAWELIVDPGDLAPGQARGSGAGAKVFRGDTITLKARFSGLSEAEQEYVQVALKDAGGLKPGTQGWEDAETYAIAITVMDVGTRRLVCEAMSQGDTLGTHEFELLAVMDLDSYSQRLNAVASGMNAKFGKALAAVGEASRMWAQAHTRHQKVLDDAAAREKLAGDLLLGALLATVAGGAGGVLAGWLKNTAALKELSKNKTLHEMAQTGVIDAAKDGLKFAIRSLPQLGGEAGSAPEVRGDSVAPPVGGAPAPRGEGTAPGDDVDTFLGKLLTELGNEYAMVMTEISRMQIAASDMMAIDSLAEFSDDPLTILENDTTLDQLAAGFPKDWTEYLEELWATWLANYSYSLEVFACRVGGALVVVSNTGGALHRPLEADAETCGTTLDAWLEQHAAPLKAKLDAERERLLRGEQP